MAGQSVDSCQTGVGAKISMPLITRETKVASQLYATWQHEFSPGKWMINYNLSQGSAAVGWLTEGSKTDFANLGGDISVIFRKDISAHINYNAEIGGGGNTTHMFGAGLRCQF